MGAKRIKASSLIPRRRSGLLGFAEMNARTFLVVASSHSSFKMAAVTRCIAFVALDSALAGACVAPNMAGIIEVIAVLRPFRADALVARPLSPGLELEGTPAGQAPRLPWLCDCSDSSSSTTNGRVSNHGREESRYRFVLFWF